MGATIKSLCRGSGAPVSNCFSKWRSLQSGRSQTTRSMIGTILPSTTVVARSRAEPAAAPGWQQEPPPSCCPPGNENHIIGGRGCLDVRGGQIGIVAAIEGCGSVFDLGDDELLDRIEADGAEPDR